MARYGKVETQDPIKKMHIFFEKQGLTFANLSKKSLLAKIQAKNDF